MTPLYQFQDFNTSQPRTLFAWGPSSTIVGDPPAASDSGFFGRLGEFIQTSATAISNAINAQRQGQQLPPAAAAPTVGISQNARLILFALVALVIILLLRR